MPSIHDVIARYRQLCSYCDSFSAMVLKKYAAEINCSRGCCGCCRLENVLGLEARVLADWLDLPEAPKFPGRDRTPTAVAGESQSSCPFLLHDACTIYPVRPIICRTHGLPLQSLSLTKGKVDCCPLNFTKTKVAAIDPAYVLNLDEITNNLIRLNLAFWLLLEQKEMAAVRFPLSEIRAGQKPESLPPGFTASRPGRHADV